MTTENPMGCRAPALNHNEAASNISPHLAAVWERIEAQSGLDQIKDAESAGLAPSWYIENGDVVLADPPADTRSALHAIALGRPLVEVLDSVVRALVRSSPPIRAAGIWHECRLEPLDLISVETGGLLDEGVLRLPDVLAWTESGIETGKPVLVGPVTEPDLLGWTYWFVPAAGQQCRGGIALLLSDGEPGAFLRSQVSSWRTAVQLAFGGTLDHPHEDFACADSVWRAGEMLAADYGEAWSHPKYPSDDQASAGARLIHCNSRVADGDANAFISGAVGGRDVSWPLMQVYWVNLLNRSGIIPDPVLGCDLGGWMWSMRSYDSRDYVSGQRQGSGDGTLQVWAGLREPSVQIAAQCPRIEVQWGSIVTWYGSLVSEALLAVAAVSHEVPGGAHYLLIAQCSDAMRNARGAGEQVSEIGDFATVDHVEFEWGDAVDTPIDGQADGGMPGGDRAAVNRCLDR